MSKYIAFLRGINVGGHKSVKMEELRKAFESMRFKNVKTLLASGNVLFQAPQANTNTLSKKIEEKLKKTFGHEINVIIRTIEELQHLFEANPFKGVKVTPQTRLYITFLSEKAKSDLQVPFESSDKNFKIIRVTESEICSVLTLSPTKNTIDLMNILEKEYGKKVTTRNWNTIIKLLQN